MKEFFESCVKAFRNKSTVSNADRVTLTSWELFQQGRLVDVTFVLNIGTLVCLLVQVSHDTSHFFYPHFNFFSQIYLISSQRVNYDRASEATFHGVFLQDCSDGFLTMHDTLEALNETVQKVVLISISAAYFASH